MGYEYYIAKRYLRPKRSQLFVSLTTLLTTLGVTIGVAALIVVLSGMNGFAGEILRQLIGMNAHMWVRSEAGLLADPTAVMDTVRQVPGVVGASPTVYEETLLANPPYAQTGAQIKGVDTTSIRDVSNIAELLEKDTVNSYGAFRLGRNRETDEPGVVLGWQLANKLQVSVGDRVFLVVPPRSAPGPMWMVQPRLVPFRVTGIFNSGFFEFDAALAVIDIGEAQQVFNLGKGVSSIEIKLSNAFAAGMTATKITRRLGGYPYSAMTWIDLNGGLYRWLMIEKWVAFVILSLIILVAAFNIISTLSMVVLDKTKEIGILKTMGATAREISRVFLYQGLVVGIIGTGAGCTLGFALCWMQDRYRLIRLPAELYQVSAFPVDMRATDFLAIGTAALLICLMSAVYPAWKAAHMDPVEAIRHE